MTGADPRTHPRTVPRTGSDAAADRRRRRRLLYLVGLVPSLLLLLVSGRIAVLLHHQAAAMGAYARGDFEQARDAFSANQVLNPVERWVAPFGEGDARYRAEDYERAVTAFEASLAVVPEEHECVVRVNLALTHEALGDALLEEEKGTKAVDAWLQARQVLGRCKELAALSPEELEELLPEELADLAPAELAELSRRELEALLARAEEQRDPEVRSRVTAALADDRLARKLGVGDPPRTQRPEEAPPEDEEIREKKRRLEERNKKAHKDNVEHKDDFDFEPTPTPSPAQPSPTPQW